MRKITYLGYEVSEHGIHTDREKMTALTTCSVPKNNKEIRTFLGFTGYSRRFVKDYAKPLNDLLVRHPTNKVAKRARKKKTP